VLVKKKDFISLVAERLARPLFGQDRMAFWRSRRTLGFLILLLSAASFGAVTPFARLAYDDGVNVVTVMVVRYALAALVVLAYLTWKRRPWRLSKRKLWPAMALAIAMGALSFAYLGSIRFLPVSLAALIYYTYPIMVTLLATITGIEKLHNRDRGTHLLVTGGQLLSLGGLALLLGLSWSTLNLVGIGMALFAAVTFSLVMLFGSRLMETIPPMVLNLHVALVNVVLFGAIAVLGTGFAWPSVSLGWLGLSGVAVFFVLGFLGLFVGVTMIGPSRAACLTNVEPVVTIGLAIAILGEPFSQWQFIGAGVVLAGILIMCLNAYSQGVIAVASDVELRQIQRLVRAVYCSPTCRDGSYCLLVDGKRSLDIKLT
jgi:drug/metabolite transporter (DMT)-like permease